MSVGLTTVTSVTMESGLFCLLFLGSGHMSGVLGQSITANEYKLIGIITGGIIGVILVVLIIVIIYFMCRPVEEKHEHTRLTEYSSSSDSPRTEKYQHLPPGIWTSNPSLAHVISNTGRECFASAAAAAATTPTQEQNNAESSNSQNVFYKPRASDLNRRLAKEHSEHSKQVLQRGHTQAAAVPNLFPHLNLSVSNLVAATAATDPRDISSSQHVLSASVYSDLPPGGSGGKPVARNNSRTVHDYVPAILGGPGLSQLQQQRRPAPTSDRLLLNAGSTAQLSDDRNLLTQPMVGALPVGGRAASGAGGLGGRGIFLRRSPSEAAVYASIPMIIERRTEDGIFPANHARIPVAAPKPAVSTNIVRRSQSDVSSACMFRVTSTPAATRHDLTPSASINDIYAVPDKVRRGKSANASSRAEHDSEAAATSISFGSKGDSLTTTTPPPPVPPVKTESIRYGQVIRTFRGTASITLGPEEEEEQLAESAQDQTEGTNGALVGREGKTDGHSSAFPPAKDMKASDEKPPGACSVPDLTRNLPEFDTTDLETADRAFRFLDQYSIEQEEHSSYLRSSTRKYPIPTDTKNIPYECSCLESKGKSIADEAFRFLDEFDDGEETTR